MDSETDLKLKFNEFFFEDFKSCPRKAVFNYNTNSFYGNRLQRSPYTPSQLAQLIYKTAFNAAFKKIQSKKSLNKYSKERIFIAAKNKFTKELKAEDYQDNSSLYDEAITAAFNTFMKTFNNAFINSKIFIADTLKKNLTLSLDIGKLLESVYTQTLKGEYLMDIQVPFIFKIDGFYYAKLFIYKNEYQNMRTDSRINLLFMAFEISKLHLKEVEVFNVHNGHSESFTSPFFDEYLFMYDLKSIFFSIDHKLYFKNFDSNECKFCHYHEQCYKNPGIFKNKRLLNTPNTSIELKYANRRKTILE